MIARLFKREAPAEVASDILDELEALFEKRERRSKWRPPSQTLVLEARRSAEPRARYWDRETDRQIKGCAAFLATAPAEPAEWTTTAHVEWVLKQLTFGRWRQELASAEVDDYLRDYGRMLMSVPEDGRTPLPDPDELTEDDFDLDAS